MKTAIIVNENVQNVNEQYSAFQKLITDFEMSYITNGSNGCYTELDRLAQAIASSVLKKVYDPQGKNAEKRDSVTKGGCNPQIAQLRCELYADSALLENLRNSGNKAFGHTFNDKGDFVECVLDDDAEKRFNANLVKGLGDGLEIKNEVIVALLEVSEKYSDNGIGYMTMPITNRRINRKVLIKDTDTVAWTDDETTPLVTVYVAARKYIDGSRAVRTDPRNGYLYLEELTADPESDALETIYRRQRRFADLGGYDNHGNYTAGDSASLRDYDDIITALNLTARQAQIIDLRMRGYGYETIGTYLGVKKQGILIQMKRVQEKAVENGIATNDGKLI